MKPLHIFLPAFLFLISCTGPKYFFKRGDYYTSALRAVEKLRKNPNHEKHQNLLDNSYNTFVKTAFSQIKDLQVDSREDSWQRIYTFYRQIQDLNIAIQSLPRMSKGKTEIEFTLNTTDISTELQSVKKKASEALYSRAETKMKENNKRAFREAYNLYRDVYEIFPTYKDDLKEKMENSRVLGTDLVSLEIKNPNREINIDWAKDALSQSVSDHIARVQSKNPFLSFAGLNAGRSDLKILFEISSFTLIPAEKILVDAITKNVIKNINTVKDDKGNTIKSDTTWETVTAKVSKRTRDLTANAIFSFKCIETPGGKVLQTREQNAVHKEVVISYRFVEGDSRALPEEIQKAIKLSEEPPLPSIQQMFEKTMLVKSMSGAGNTFDLFKGFLAFSLN